MRSVYAVALIAVIAAATPVDTFAKGSGSYGGSYSVRGYSEKDGYVAPHHATNPNRTKSDNWSTKGGVNPYTGKVGAKSGQ